MASDPQRPQEPFNRLYDTARARGFRVGLRAGELLVGRSGTERRDIVAIECKTAAGTTLVATIGVGGLHAAAQALLAKLPAAAA